MIRINLLPVREERRRAGARQLLVVMAAAVLGSAALAGMFHMKVRSDLSDAKSQVAATQKQIDAFGPQLKQVEEYRKTKQEIEAKLDVIERLHESRSGPVHVLDELATHTPERLWVENVEAKGQMIKIRGMSLDNELVALFLTALNDSDYFKNVELLETQAEERGGFKLNSFSLSAQLTSPATERRLREKAAKQQQAAAPGRGTAQQG